MVHRWVGLTAVAIFMRGWREGQKEALWWTRGRNHAARGLLRQCWHRGRQAVTLWATRGWRWCWSGSNERLAYLRGRQRLKSCAVRRAPLEPRGGEYAPQGDRVWRGVGAGRRVGGPLDYGISMNDWRLDNPVFPVTAGLALASLDRRAATFNHCVLAGRVGAFVRGVHRRVFGAGTVSRGEKRRAAVDDPGRVKSFVRCGHVFGVRTMVGGLFAGGRARSGSCDSFLNTLGQATRVAVLRRKVGRAL
jgi:hypothetical protein